MSVVAYVLVRTKPGTSHQITGSRRVRGVKMAHSLFGRYDAVLVISAKNLDELSKTIYDVVEKHPEVEHTECLLAVPFPPEQKPPSPTETYTVISFNCPNCNTLNKRGSVSCQFCGYLFKKTE